MAKTEKIVVITGAAGGIGLAIAEAFTSQDYIAVLLDLHEESVKAATTRLKKNRAIGFTCDVTREEQIRKIFSELMQQFGRIDVLVNNAGLQYVSPLEDFPTEKFRYMLDVMLTAPFIAIKQVVPIMKAQHSGRIINMASINGLIGFAGKAAYNSAKHGLIGLTKVAALETATSGITVNAICPGYVDTPLVRNQLQDIAKMRGLSLEKVLEEVIYPLVPQKRLLSPEEIANYILFLSGQEARGITGQAIIIDGGYTVQ